MLKRLWNRLFGNGKTDHEIEDVRACHKKFGILVFDEPGHLTKRKLKERIDFLKEELKEFEEACESQDLPLQLDALVDLCYVAKGTAAMLGIDGPLWRDLWDDVQRANMAKERGVTKRGHKVDLIKPPGWKPPETRFLLSAAGYDRYDWSDPLDATLTVDEDSCRDDEEAA